MSNLVPSSLQQPQGTPSYYTDCYSCRLTGTITFSAVGLYALSVARMQAKTQFGKGIASLSGLGQPTLLRVFMSSSRGSHLRPSFSRVPRDRSREVDQLQSSHRSTLDGQAGRIEQPVTATTRLYVAISSRVSFFRWSIARAFRSLARLIV